MTVKRHKLCHACVKSGDMRTRCVSKLFCKCGNDRRHHKLLHHPRKSNTGDAEQDPQCGKQPKKPPAQIDAQAGRELRLSVKPRTTEQYTTVKGNVLKTVLLHVVPVKLIAPNGSALTIATYGLLDNASRGTVISSDTANTLGLKGKRELVCVNTLMEETNEELQEVNFQVQSACGVGEIITVSEGVVSAKFNLSGTCLPKDVDKPAHPHRKDVEIPERGK